MSEIGVIDFPPRYLDKPSPFVKTGASNKDVFDLIVTKQEERIVLVKKEN